MSIEDWHTLPDDQLAASISAHFRDHPRHGPCGRFVAHDGALCEHCRTAFRKASHRQLSPVYRFVWGHIKHHMAPCDECDGTGLDGGDTEVDEDGLEADPCCICDGEGEVRWGSFYWDDDAWCDHCGCEGAPVSCGVLEDAAICLPCYLRSHRKQCGCNLWAEAEMVVLGGFLT